MSTFGFIITRHVNSEQTNKYWNQCVKLIRTIYPLQKIIIIDDNSNYNFVKADFQYANLEVIQSEFIKRGELLPFIYYLRHKWFPSAVIIHDSTFVHKKINFNRISAPVLPLWHHNYDKENESNIIRILSSLKNHHKLMNRLHNTKEIINIFGIKNDTKFNLCFGCQCFIRLPFLEMLEQKYKLTNLIPAIQCRTDRCSLERVMGLIFHEESPHLSIRNSLFGDIYTHHSAFGYHYDEYVRDTKHRRIRHSFIKIWTGR